ncbi:MAG TPA: TonB-dependent receptor plug domain-containing protein, partial [Dyella sp.]|uniref:TonB-dependent receptor plug domain-containing protein n=1 Tax=Dyella sp. TaxID=1869338 RepID=UPI002BDA6D59
MNHGTTKLSAAVRLALSLGAAIAVGATATSAFAQDTSAQQGTSTQDQNNGKPKTLQTITVTGSHIRRVDVETSNPVVTIDSAAIRSSGKLTLGDLVQELPAVTGGNVTPQVNNGGGSGAATVGLRGLGAQRTLVLIDGHRIIPSASNGFVDLNSIPTDMVERIEVLTDGASAVYGSDAIGGVINVILKKNYNGATLSAQYGQSGHGDGASKAYTAAFGHTSDNWDIMGGADYNQTDGIEASRRQFSKNSVSISGSPGSPIQTYVGGSSFGQYGRIQVPASLQGTNGFPNCGYVALNKGAAGASGSDYHCFGNSDKYNYASVNLIDTPQKRTSVWVKGDYKFGDHVTAYVEGYHNKTEAAFQLAPALLGTDYGLVIPANNPYNIFGVPYDSADNNFRLRAVSIGNRQADSKTTSDQWDGGVRGDFDIFNQNWTWDLNIDYGRSAQDLTTLNLPNITTINQDLACTSAASGCTPLDIFNQFSSATAATLKNAAAPAYSNTLATQRVYSLDANGGLFDLPAGTVQLAAGLDYRINTTSSHIDPLLTIDPATGNCTLGSQCSSPLSGSYNVKEVYTELFVPVLANLPGVSSLNVTIGDRYSKYSDVGSTNNTKFAIEYRPISDVLLRGTVATVFRAPAIGDVFGSPISDAPLLKSDPCDGATVANPACEGVPLNGKFVDQDVALGQQIKGLISGSQYAGVPLKAEQGKSFDLGVVYSPSYVEGLSLSADFWHIYLNDTISSVGAQTVLNMCYSGVTTFCPLITRYTSGPNAGQINQIIEPTANLGSTTTGGIDFSTRYKLPHFSFGDFVAGIDATYLKYYNQQTAPGTSANVTYYDAGHFEPYGSPQASTCPSGGGICLFPRWRGSTFLNWTMGNWSASWRTRYIGRFQNGSTSPSQDTHPAGTTLDGVVFKYGATVYH